MIARRTSRRWTILLGVVSLIAAGCSVEQLLPPPDCVQGDSSLIVAQSVPGAELVPCLDGVPDGWNVASVIINENGTDILFDSDRAGEDAAHLRYKRSCDLGDAVLVPNDQAGAQTFEYIERLEPGFRGSRYFTFDGGCVWWEFDFDNDASATLSVELRNTLVFFTRDQVNQNIRDSFIDEEL